MNFRERYISTLTYSRPDRIPFMPGSARESTLRNWHDQGLPAGVPYMEEVQRLLGFDAELPAPLPGMDIDFRMVPQFEEIVLERRAASLVVQDWKGNICEISDRFDVTYLRNPRDFVTRRWLKCPVQGREDWEQMKVRYLPDEESRFPADFDNRCRTAVQSGSLVGIQFPGPFWQLREWMGFEGLCIAFLEQPDLVKEMIAFWQDFVLAMLDRVLEHVKVDSVVVQEDMAYKEKSMISPALIREFIMPAWTAWNDRLLQGGCPVRDVDSDGYVGEIIPLWIEAGFNANNPLEAAAGNDLPAYSRLYGSSMGWHGGVDKRAMARGGQSIIDEMERLTPVIDAGGYIPSCDHGIPSDVSWPCMVEYCRLLAKKTGWL